MCTWTYIPTGGTGISTSSICYRLLPRLLSRPQASRNVPLHRISVCPRTPQLRMLTDPAPSIFASGSQSPMANTTINGPNPFLLSHSHQEPAFIVTPPVVGSSSAQSSPLTPQKTYNGGYSSASTVRLRVGNGGAGQSGLIGAFADAFIKWRVQEFGEQPFLVSLHGIRRYDLGTELYNIVGRMVSRRYDADSVIPLFGIHRRRLHLQRSR